MLGTQQQQPPSLIQTAPEGTHVNVMHMMSMQPGTAAVGSSSLAGGRAPRDPNTRPVCKLTGDLIKTYKTINENYYNRKAHRRKHESSGGGGGELQQPQIKQLHQQPAHTSSGMPTHGMGDMMGGQMAVASSSSDAVPGPGSTHRQPVKYKGQSARTKVAAALSLSGETTGGSMMSQPTVAGTQQQKTRTQLPQSNYAVQQPVVVQQAMIQAMDHDSNVDCDDENHDYIIKVGEIFNYRRVFAPVLLQMIN